MPWALRFQLYDYGLQLLPVPFVLLVALAQLLGCAAAPCGTEELFKALEGLRWVRHVQEMPPPKRLSVPSSTDSTELTCTEHIVDIHVPTCTYLHCTSRVTKLDAILAVLSVLCKLSSDNIVNHCACAKHELTICLKAVSFFRTKQHRKVLNCYTVCV